MLEETLKNVVPHSNEIPGFLETIIADFFQERYYFEEYLEFILVKRNRLKPKQISLTFRCNIVIKFNCNKLMYFIKSINQTRHMCMHQQLMSYLAIEEDSGVYFPKIGYFCPPPLISK